MGALTAWDYSTTPPTLRELRCNAQGELIVAGVAGVGGGASGGLTNTELRAAAVAVSAVAIGSQSDARATWYDSAASVLSVLKLAVAAFVGAGSRTYTYANGALASEAWTLFGLTRTKTYTYTNGVLTSESDWV